MEKGTMLIHIVTDNFSTGGGIEHIFQIVKGMPALNFRIFADAGDALAKFSGLGNVETCPHGYSPALVLKTKPDLIHIHQLRPLLAFYRNPLARYEIPVIYTAHGLHIHKYEFLPGVLSNLKYKLRFALEKYLFARVEQIITVSQADQYFIRTKYKLNHVRYIANGIDPSRLEEVQSQREIGDEFQLPAKRILFITVARFNFQKGYDVLIRAIALIRDFLKEKNAFFLLVGDGETLPEMKKMSERLQVTDLVRFSGTRKDVYSLMKSADLLILTSRWEGLPIVLLEAGLLKLPVIASDTFGNNELLGEDRGVMFKNENILDLAEKIQRILNGEYKLATQAENLYHFVNSNFSVARMLAGLQDTYAATIGGKGGNPEN
ncbi:MAG: glycosyltransferase [Candidatus Aminicenantes bacterium]|nr:glycosyltransferase [Candidatus Aminicenantes bacterium]